ncbi:unnamed protein product [Gongylonema pulchrum]|uniref:Uncharacterized protein n=1 Tax=Gongylonema pulchrum TaxID=637853 RepID=A0A183E5M5_9BILA|nr:unnamed protein product [Gongylonema pulchrum]
MDYGKSRGLSRITYGCTELVGPKQFVEQVRIYTYKSRTFREFSRPISGQRFCSAGETTNPSTIHLFVSMVNWY